MKVIIVDGIQNKTNSMTKVLLEKCLAGMADKAPDAEIETIRLIDTPIEFCVGCKKCGQNADAPIGNCVLDDAMKNILPKLLDADRIIFASPIYDFSFSSLLKRFVERSLPMCVYPENRWPTRRNKPRQDKKGLVLLVSDCPAPINWLIGITWHASLILRMISKTFGCRKVKVLSAGGMRISSKLRNRFEQAAFRYGQQLVG